MDFLSLLEHHILDHRISAGFTVFVVQLAVTKHVVMMWISGGVLLATLPLLARNWPRVPGGARGALELAVVYFRDEVILPNIYPRALDLIDESRRAGCRQVLVSGALDFTMRPLARYLGVDDLIANRLEFREGYATGKLAKPFVGGATKPILLRDYARQHEIDLAESWAYSDSYSDLTMLAVVGRPTACNPDRRLRAVARSYDWPVLDLN